LYGQGKTGDMNGLLKNIPGMTVDDAKANSELFISRFKGDRRKYRNVLNEEAYEYRNGLASFSFNVMEKIADSKQPKTPLFNNLLSRSLAGIRDFKPSRVNWVIQSSGVDFRDMYVLLARHFFKKLGVQGKLLMSIHDEFRFLVKEGQEILAAYACQLTHLYVRAAFIDALSLDCIPTGIAWHSAVDIDHYCLRKDPKDPQVTPSQPEGLPKGYTISPQQLLESLTEHQIAA
jgi:DNA polymerase gamma 1